MGIIVCFSMSKACATHPNNLDKCNQTLLGCASVRGHLVFRIIDAGVMIGGEGFMRQSGTA